MNARGGARKSAGRKPRATAKRYNVFIEIHSADVLRALGDSNLSKGIDMAADLVERKSDEILRNIRHKPKEQDV